MASVEVPVIPATPLPASLPPPLPYLNLESVRGELLNERLRRIGRFAVTLGFGGAVASVLTLMDVGAGAGRIRYSFRSSAIADAMYFGVPVLIVVFFVPIGSSGLRLLRGLRTADAWKTRQTLLLMRGLLLGGLLLSLMGTVIGMSGSSTWLFAAVNVVCFVGSALLATRVRDGLFDLANVARAAAERAERPPEPRPVLPVLALAAHDARPTPVTAVDDDTVGANVPVPTPVFAGTVSELQYAIERDDPVHDFLRLFDLLAIFGCVIYGLHVPAALDNSVMLITNFLGGGGVGAPANPVPRFGGAGGGGGGGGGINAAVAAVLTLLAAFAGVGWALWGAAYVAFGPVFYRTCFALAIASLLVAALSTWMNLGRPTVVSLTLVTALMPSVMVFCLTRRRVRATFYER